MTTKQHDGATARTRGTVDISSTLYFFLDLAEILLAFRLVLKIFGVTGENGFARLVYALSQPLVAPFLHISTRHAALYNGSILLAMAAYAVAMYLFVQFLRLFDET